MPTLTSAEQVRRLSPAEAGRGYPVRVHGVVTYSDADWGHLFVQDSTAGIFITPPEGQVALTPGTLAEIEGATAPGDFAPVVIATAVTSRGEGKLPKAGTADFRQLRAGKRDSQFIQIQGVVRTVALDRGHALLSVDVGEGRLDVFLPGFAEASPPTHLVDAGVTIRGVCAALVNQRQQSLGIKMFCPGLDFVTVTEPAPTDPFAAPTRAIRSLLQFSTTEDSNHRVKVEGVVTLQRGGRNLFIQDDTGGLYILTAGRDPAQPGERVEVVGFAEVGEYTPMLTDASFRKIGTAPRPAPVLLTAEQAVRGTNDAQVVQIEAELLDQERRGEDDVLTLQQGQWVFQAHLQGAPAPSLAALRRGSWLRLTGVCSVQVDRNRVPRSFRVLLRSAEDVAVLRAPSWWTMGRATALLAAAGGLALLALAWVLGLRRRVRGQTEIITRQQKSEAALERRCRQLFETANDVVYIHDLEGNFKAFNPAGHRLLGYSRAECERLNLAQLVAPEQLALARSMTARKTAGESVTTYELDLLAKDGRRVSVEVSSQPVVRDGQVVAIQGIARDITERKRAEHQLEQSLSLLHATLESTADGILVVDRAGQVVSYNQKFRTMWRLPEELLAAGQDAALIANVLAQVAHPEQFQARIQEVYQHAEAESYDVIEFNDGRAFARYSQPQRVRDQIVGRVWSFRDITEQCQAERALRESEARFRALSETNPAGVWQTTPEGRTLYLNPAMCRILEIAGPAEIDGQTYRDFYTPDSIAIVEREHAKRRAGLASCYEVELVGRRGTRRSVSIHGAPLRQPDGQVENFIAVLVDITERKRAEEALRQSEDLFARAFNASPTSIGMSTLAEGRYLKVNEAFLRMFGYTRDEVIGRTASELGIWVDPTQRARVVDGLREGKPVRDLECQFRTKAGGLRTALTSMEQIELDGEPCVLFINHDITERLLLEEQFRQAQKMESVGRLAAGVAHDFNNMLTVITGHASLLLADPRQQPETIESVNQIASAAERAANLTRQLLTFSRRQVMQPRTLDVNEIVSNLSKMLCRLMGEHIALQCHYSPVPPLVHADAGMIEQVLMNLAVNARDAMAKGGQLTLDTQTLRLDAHSAQRHPDARAGQWVCLSVTDTGCGMDPATQARIFEPFFTTKDVGKGTGLGLATVYGIVQQHHGWIEVTSQLGKGTTFRIFLPRSAGAVRPDATATVPAAQRGRETILLVEDEPGVLKLARSVLAHYGYRVLDAPNGPEALKVWADHSEQIDMLLTDLVMPGGLSGRELAEQLRARQPDLPVIVASGYSAELLGPEFEQWITGSHFLRKPYAPQELAQAVRQSLDGRERSERQ
ncbi:MAG: PAS domain S-box protein [Verrucomicrobia bacterium]|nr:PAS domain S-box protein [Verrucomicrobiota bacterium]